MDFIGSAWAIPAAAMAHTAMGGETSESMLYQIRIMWAMKMGMPSCSIAGAHMIAVMTYVGPAGRPGAENEGDDGHEKDREEDLASTDHGQDERELQPQPCQPDNRQHDPDGGDRCIRW